MEKLNYQFQNAWAATTPSDQQSPIAIESKKVVFGDDLSIDLIDFQQTSVRKKEEVIGDQFYCHGKIKINGEIWELIRFHLHDGAEHLIDGNRSVGEIHFVFQNQNKETMVVGALLEENLNAPIRLQPILLEETENVNLSALLPTKSMTCFTYTGSLTTPPLRQGISWLLFEQSLGINPQDFVTFAQAYPDNHRDCQPLSGRVVICHNLRWG